MAALSHSRGRVWGSSAGATGGVSSTVGTSAMASPEPGRSSRPHRRGDALPAGRSSGEFRAYRRCLSLFPNHQVEATAACATAPGLASGAAVPHSLRSAARFMHTIYVILALSLLPPALAGDARLVATPGKHQCGRTILEIDGTVGMTNTISYSVTFTARVPNAFGPEFGPRKIEMTTSNSASNLVVDSQRWAFYFAKEADVWFYDGLGQYRRFQRTGAGLRISATCSDPALGSHAPKALRRFVRDTSTNYAASQKPHAEP